MATAPFKPANSRRDWAFSMKTLLFLVALAAVGSWFARQFYFANRAATSSVCSARFSQIARGLWNYNYVNGSLPPAYLLDDRGLPQHSWRALIFDHMLSASSYPVYRLGEPWNGPNNSLLAERAGEDFQCTICRGWREGAFTNCLAITGPGTAFPGAKPVTQAEMTDGPENTVIAVHVDSWDHLWMEPRDLTLAEIDAAIASGGPYPWRGCSPEGYIYVIMGDCRTQYMDASIPPQVFRALVTISGGEKVTQAKLVEQGYFR